MLANHFLEDVPDDGVLLFHHLLGSFDRRAVASLFEPVINERFEQFERHSLRKAALMQLKIRANHDDGTSRIVDALSKQVLAETPLLALQRVRQRLERAVIGTAQHPATTAVIKQGVDSLLQHPLLVANDYIRRVQFDELLQSVVAVDHTTVEVIQVRRRKASTIQWNQRPQFRWNDWNRVQDHPFGLVA